MSLELIDTHCHLASLTHLPLDTIFENARKAGVTRMICVGAGDEKKSAVDAVRLAEKCPNVWASVGIHPHDAAKFSALRELETLAVHPRVVAIGETGLDFYRDWAPKENQYRLFENTIAFAREVRKPLIIHCRDAAEETLMVLKKNSAEDVGGVFHCYAENAAFAERLADINFIVSFPGSLTFKNAALLREAAWGIPLDRIMLETDAPYMAPEPYRGKPSEPAHVFKVALKLAEIKELPLDEIARATTANAERLFGLSQTPAS